MATRKIVTYTVARQGQPQPPQPAPAVKTTTDDATAQYRRGNKLVGLGRHEEAVAAYDQALALQPSHVLAHINRGVALGQLGRHGEALAILDRAIELEPQRADAHAHRGLALSRLGRHREALPSYDQAIRLQPDHADAYANRGTALKALGRLDESLASYDRAIALRPDHPDTHTNRGNLLKDLGRYTEALASHDRAIALAPAAFNGRWNRSLCHLMLGHFAQGWLDYAVRLDKWAAETQSSRKTKHALWTPADFGKPMWDGRAGHVTLLVWAEQGLGDQILFASMLREACSRVDKVMLVLEARLHPLFKRSFPDCAVMTFDRAVQQGGYDVQIPMGHLGALFRNHVGDFLRNRQAYLVADAARSAALRKAIAPGRGLICGVAWFSRNDDIGAHKSITLSALRPLLETPGYRFIDLQYGDTADERAAFKKQTGLDITRLDAVDNRQDIDGFAALIDACDVIVTVSNTTAHIAGALGKEVWLMLPHSTGRLWYWQTDRDDTLWYPNVHVVRQHAAGDWGPVVERVCAALAPASRAPAVDATTDEATVQYRRGNKLVGLGRHEEAVAAYDQALALQPSHVLAHINRGVALGLLGRHGEALAILDRAIELEPQRADAHAHRGLALSRLGRHREALPSYDEAIRLQPDHADAYSNRGIALKSLGRLEESLASCDRASALRPDSAAALSNRSNLLIDLGRHAEAITCLDRLVALVPGDFKGRWNRCICHLLTGEFALGWQAHPARWEKWLDEAAREGRPQNRLLTPARFKQPLWDGRTAPVTLLVWGEQGIGDQILFASMLHEAIARTDKVIIALEERLHPLFRRSFPYCEVTTLPQARRQGGYDVQIPMGDLGQLFRNRLDDFLRNRRAFLVADSKRSAALRKTIAPVRGLICGVSWFSRNDDIGAHKSIALAALRPLLETPGYRFIDLQYGDTADERAAFNKQTGLDITHLDAVDNRQDIDGFAALVNACDVIVTVSNTTAHIAGALGKEVWLMLPHNIGRLWYWQIDRTDALCYPHVHVLRQRVAGDWDEVIGRVRTALDSKPESKAPLAKASRTSPASTKKPATAIKKRAPAK